MTRSNRTDSSLTVESGGVVAVAERPAEHDLDFRTHFERRMRLHNAAVFRAEFRRPAS